MRLLVHVLLVLLGWLLPALPSCAQEARLALLIGNKGYAQKVGPLKNPHNDVDLVGAALKKLGFKVTILKDATYKQMDAGLKRYVTEVRRAGRGALSFFYYSGHGVLRPETQENYLIPVDVAEADDDRLWFESLQQSLVIDSLSRQAANATHYLVFDACRNELNVSGAKAKALGADKGFVPVADISGLLIAYATAPKRTASDAGEGGGPYARVLAEELVRPGIESVSMFRNVQIRVKQTIGQDPWLSFPSLPPVYLAGQAQAAPPPPPPKAQPAAPGTAGPSAAAREWQDVKDTERIPALERYAERHRGDPVYAELALGRIEALKGRQAVALASAAEAQRKAEEATRARAEAERVAAEADALAKAAEALRLRPGRVFSDCAECPEMVVLPKGSYKRGSEDGDADEKPVRGVTIGYTLAVGRFEVTRGQFAAFIAATGHKMDGGCHTWSGTEWKHQPDKSWRSPGFAQDESHPVTCINWDDAQAFAAWLSKRSGREYRLLTEAEWEFAARGVISTSARHNKYHFGDDADKLCDYANGADGSAKSQFKDWTVAPCTDGFVFTAPVGKKLANPFGLHDMHGNVWEWVQDCYADTYANAPTDGSKAPETNACRRVLRGGSWGTDPQFLRAASRFGYTTDNRYDDLGFRVGRTLTP